MRKKYTKENLISEYKSWHNAKFLVGPTSSGALTIGSLRITDFDGFKKAFEASEMSRNYSRQTLTLCFWECNFYIIEEDGSIRNLHGVLHAMNRRDLILPVAGKRPDHYGKQIVVFHPKFVEIA